LSAALPDRRGFDHVAQHRIVDLYLGCVRPTANEIASILVNRGIGDVGNVREGRQRLTGGFLIAQVHRNEPEILSTRQFRFAPGNTDNIPACSEE
jgi:hypothetical protein